MKPIYKALLWIGGIGTFLYATTKIASNATNFNDLSNKLQLYVGIPSIDSIKNGFINLNYAQMSIMNQSPFTANIDNLFVSIQYQNTKTQEWVNWILQTKSIATFQLLANQLNHIPPVYLSIPINLGFISDLLAQNVGSQIKVITRFNFYGFAFTLETLQDASYLLNKIKSVTGSF